MLTHRYPMPPFARMCSLQALRVQRYAEALRTVCYEGQPQASINDGKAAAVVSCHVTVLVRDARCTYADVTFERVQNVRLTTRGHGTRAGSLFSGAIP